MALDDDYARALADIMGSNASYQAKQQAVGLLKQRYQNLSKSTPPLVAPPEGMAPTGATIEGVNYRPLPDVELADRERALKQADLIASRYQIPFIQTPGRPEVPSVGTPNKTGYIAGKPAVPVELGYRRGSTADFMSGSNPFQTYSQVIPAIDGEAGVSNYRPAQLARPMMYFGRDIPAVPVSQEDYMQVMDLSSRAAGNRVPMTTPTGQATPVPPVVPTATPRYVQSGTPVPIATPTPMIAQADPFADIPVVGDPSIIGNTAFRTQPLKKLDMTLARNFLNQAGNNPQKARQLAKQSGYFW